VDAEEVVVEAAVVEAVAKRSTTVLRLKAVFPSSPAADAEAVVAEAVDSAVARRKVLCLSQARLWSASQWAVKPGCPRSICSTTSGCGRSN